MDVFSIHKYTYLLPTYINGITLGSIWIITPNNLLHELDTGHVFMNFYFLTNEASCNLSVLSFTLSDEGRF